jgi:hypothetical protein
MGTEGILGIQESAFSPLGLSYFMQLRKILSPVYKIRHFKLVTFDRLSNIA